MNRKNVALFFLLLFCVFLIYAWRTERSAWLDRPLSAADYGGLISLRDVLPPEQFKQEVVPLLQKAADGVQVTRRQLNDLNDRLGNVSKQALSAAQKLRPQEELIRAWENAKQGATDLGSQLSRNMDKAKDELSRMLDDVTRPDAPKGAPQSPPKDAPKPGADVPTQI